MVSLKKLIENTFDEISEAFTGQTLRPIGDHFFFFNNSITTSFELNLSIFPKILLAAV